MYCRFSFVVLVLLLLGRPGLAQVMISEFMASNTRTLADDFGQFEDWIEIYNHSSTNVALLDWALTDSAGNLAKWRFPATNLPPRQHLLVWASNRDRRIPGAPLHTNFKLDPGGEYLALVKPDGTVASQFAPEYAPQVPDASYGFGTMASTWKLLSTGAVGRVTVPLNDSLELIWNSTNLNDSSWLPATNGIGFETGASEFPTNTPGDLLADGPLGYWRLNEVATNTAATNRGSLGATGNGQFKGSVAVAVAGPRPSDFPGFEAGNTAARFNGSNATVDISYAPSFNPAGPLSVECWVKPGLLNTRQCPVSSINFSGNNRSGYLLYQSELNVFEFRVGNSTGYVATVAAGTVQPGIWHHLVGVYDGATASLYVNGVLVGTLATSGAFQPNTVSPFRIGATGNGTGSAFFNGDIDEVAMFARALSASEIGQRYEIAVSSTANYTSLIKTDLRAAMAGLNSSVYYRLPFTLTNAADLASLTFRAKYDDGFAGYLNGAQAVSANAPGYLTWNAAATARHPTQDARQFEEFDLSGQIGALKNGTNVLALQGLNVATANPDFLMLPELEATSVSQYQAAARFFVLPTPSAPNGGGSKDLGPIISETGHWPTVPGTNDSITVTCRVTQAFAPAASVTLNWRVMYGATNQPPCMTTACMGMAWRATASMAR